MNLRLVRRYLPKELKKLTDEEVIALVNRLEFLAELFIDTFNENDSKKQRGVIDSQEGRHDNGKRS